MLLRRKTIGARAEKRKEKNPPAPVSVARPIDPFSTTLPPLLADVIPYLEKHGE